MLSRTPHHCHVHLYFLRTGASGSAVTTPSSGISRCSTLWPVKLVGLMRQHLGWIPAEMDVQKKVYWSVLLLDTLQGRSTRD